MSRLVTCECGKRFNVKDELAGTRRKCPSCGQTLVIPPIAPPAADPPVAPASLSCPSCDESLPSGAVFCVHCGHDLRTGQKRNRATVVASPSPVASAPHEDTEPSSPPWVGWAVGGLCLVLVVIVAVSGFTMFGARSKPSKSSSDTVKSNVPVAAQAPTIPLASAPPLAGGPPVTPPPISPSAPSVDGSVPVVPGVGSPAPAPTVRGPLAFEVKSAKSQRNYRYSHFGQEATMRAEAGFLILVVDVLATNTGASPATFNSSSFQVTDSAGTTVAATFVGFDNTISASGMTTIDDWNSISIDGALVLRFKGTINSNEPAQTMMIWELPPATSYTLKLVYVIPAETSGPRLNAQVGAAKPAPTGSEFQFSKIRPVASTKSG